MASNLKGNMNSNFEIALSCILTVNWQLSDYVRNLMNDQAEEFNGTCSNVQIYGKGGPHNGAIHPHLTFQIDLFMRTLHFESFSVQLVV